MTDVSYTGRIEGGKFVEVKIRKKVNLSCRRVG
jgi:hypothetical protein